MNNIIIENENGKMNVKKAREEIKALPDSDRSQCEKIIDAIERMNVKFAFRFSVLMKHNCGHWEHNQTARVEFINNHPAKCTRCICGQNWKAAGIEYRF